MRIFVDVGSHFGETLEEVIKDKYKFDKIYSFEPSKKCIKKLNEIKDKRIEFFNFGFSNFNQEVKLYNSGLAKASIYTNKETDDFEIIKLIKISDWFKKYIQNNDIVVVKLNCEGSECDIIDDLISSNEINKIYNLLITFDIRFFNKIKKRELEIRKKLKRISLYNYCFSDDVMKGIIHEKRIENWLNIIGIVGDDEDLNELRKKNNSILKKYAIKSGIFNRFESNMKRYVYYNHFPNFIKNILRYIKKKLGLSREYPK
tara:strand:+ start:1339 stop:2115 length:777 start_codon:yes stop_codon:yes gene_type:complete